MSRLPKTRTLHGVAPDPNVRMLVPEARRRIYESPAPEQQRLAPLSAMVEPPSQAPWGGRPAVAAYPAYPFAARVRSVPFDHAAREREEDEKLFRQWSKRKALRSTIVQIIGLFLLGGAMGGAYRILETPAARTEALAWITAAHPHSVSEWMGRTRGAIDRFFADW